MIDRTLMLVLTLVIVLLASPLAATAQPAGKPPRIGILWPWAPSATTAYANALREGLRDSGYVEGQNLETEWRFAERGETQRLPELAAELVARKVAVIVAPNTPAALAARDATKIIPIVFVLVQDPVGTGLVTSLARPGGNLTGLTNISPDITGKRLALLKEAVPRATRVAVLTNPTRALTNAQVLEEAAPAARSLGFQLRIVEAGDPAGFGRAFATMKRERSDALLIVGDTMFYAQAAPLAELALKTRLPSIGWAKEIAEAGHLLSYGPNQSDLLRRSGNYVARILGGARPSDLPVEQPTRIELVINAKTARALGLTIPPSLLLRADQIIE